MKIRHIAFFVFGINLIFSQSLCMHEKKQIGQKKKAKIIRGQEVFNYLAGYVNSKKEEERKKSLQLISDNIISLSLFKANNSLQEISNELTDLPIIGAFFKLPFVSYFVNKVSNLIISQVVNFKEVNKKENREIIKEKMRVTLEKNINESKVNKKEMKKLSWFINIYKDLDAKKKKNKRMMIDVLCVAVYVAIKNEKMFKYFLELGKVNKGYHDYFYKKLSNPKHIYMLEKKIKDSCEKSCCE